MRHDRGHDVEGTLPQARLARDSPAMSDAMAVFDRRCVRRHRDRAAAGLGQHDFLLVEVAARLAERLDEIRRRFPRALDLGCRDGALGRAIDGRSGIERLVSCDLSGAMVVQSPGLRLVADEEYLPFAPACFDLIVSSLSLHWVNDLPGTLIQIRDSLKPDGLFLAALFGGGTLAELREAFLAAEAECEDGASPRVSPFADVPDAGALLQRAGFALPVVDSDRITVTYDDPLNLMADLRGMGETNAAVSRRRRFTRRTTMMAAAQTYRDRFADPDGRIRATFQVIYLTAWRPDESQPKAAPRGSAEVSLATALGPKED